MIYKYSLKWEYVCLLSRVFFDVGDTNTILTIKNAQRSDAGKYEIFVENNLGTDQSFARVDIL